MRIALVINGNGDGFWEINGNERNQRFFSLTKTSQRIISISRHGMASFLIRVY